MLEFDLFKFVRHSDTLLAVQREIEAHEGEVLTPEEQRNCAAVMRQIEIFLAHYEIDTGRCFERIQTKISRPEFKTKLSALVLELRNRINDEISKHLYMYIPAKQAEYHNHAGLFGQEVRNRFPKANKEATDAGNCYAAANWTATVFHLMRVVEFGLRALARKLKVKLPRPIELEEWAGIIRAIEKEILKIEQMPKTRRREKDLEFYHGAASQFRHFKNAWRNHVMHTRASYDEEEAGIVMRHVDEFMRHIAAKLKE